MNWLCLLKIRSKQCIIKGETEEMDIYIHQDMGRRSGRDHADELTKS